MIQPHPITMMLVAERRLAEFHAEAESYRLARRAERRADLQGWIDLTAVIAFVLALAFLFSVGSAVAEESSPADERSFVKTDGRAVTQVLDEHLLDPTAALAVGGARL